MDIMKKNEATMTVICLVVSYFLGCFFKTSSNIVMPMYQELFGLSSSSAGLISGLFFLPYAIMQVMCGPLCNRYGEARIVGIGLACTAAGSLCFAFASSTYLVLLGRFVTGIGVGPMYVGIASFVARNYSADRYGFWLGMGFASGAIGTILASSPLQVMLDAFGVATVFAVIAFALLLLSAILLHLGGGIEAGSAYSALDLHGLFVSPFLTLKERNNLIFFFAWAVFTSLLTGIQGLWGTKWTEDAFPGFASLSGLPVTFIGIGSIIASYLSPMLFRSGERRKRYLDLWSSAYLLSYVLLVVFFHYAGSFSSVVFLSFMLGFSEMSAGLQLSSFMRENSEPGEFAVVVGISNFSAGFANLAVQAGSGLLVDVLGRSYGMAYAFDYVFAGFSVILCVIVVSIFMLKPCGGNA